ncbi:MAG: hypothetical protein KIT33_10395 [Candidatus Kapabacteria bacterium]|nr:hypothetical protein [Ignavibacteriota bacterium]MCW5885368.1 hypothetical protein [Candidatus Kapabacteria bacterium]
MDFNKEINMITDLEKEGIFEGYWWIPENPDEKIAGVAKYDGKHHIVLKLYGHFSCMELFKKNQPFQVILGQYGFNNRISLLDCYGSFPSMSKTLDGVFDYSFFTCDEFIEGYHVQKISELLITRVDISFTNLSHWFDSRFNLDESAIESDNLVKKSDYLLNDVVVLSDGLKIEFISHLTSTTPNNIRKQSEVKSYISLYHSEGKSLSYFKKIISKLQALLSFAMRGQAYPKEIKIFPTECGLQIDNFILNNDLKIKYVFPQRGDFNECKEKLAQNMLFNYSHVKENISEILSKWIIESEEFGLAFELYFSILFNQNMYMEHKFLSYVQAIEGLLRIFQDGKTIIDPEKFVDDIYNPIKNILPKYIDNSFKSKICTEVKRLNDLSLKNRIDLIVQDFSIDFKTNLFFKGINESCFTRDIADIRNYLSHLFVSAPNSYNNHELFNKYIHRLKVLLEILLFRVIGLEQKEIEEIIPRSFFK